MSPLTRLRLLAAALGLLALAARVAAEFLVDSATHPLLILVTLLLPLLMLVGAYAFMIWPERKGPATFQLRPGRFAADAHPSGGVGVIAVGWLGGWLATTSLPLVVTAILVIGGSLLCYLPKATLTGQGLIIRAVGIRRLRWEDLAAPDKSALTRQNIELDFRSQDDRWRSVVLRRQARYVDDAFLVAAIAHYVANPEHRAQIGSEAELARLAEATRQTAEQATPAVWPAWIVEQELSTQVAAINEDRNLKLVVPAPRDGHAAVGIKPVDAEQH